MCVKHLTLTTALAACLALMAEGALAAPAPAGTFSWTGLYAGLHLGVGAGGSTWSDINVPSASSENLAGEFSHQNLTGVGGGGQVGYLYQTDRFVLGVEGRIGYADLNGSTDCTGNAEYGDYHAACQTKVGWNGDLTARVGYTPVDRALVYFKGGGAWAHTRFQPAGEHGYPSDPTTGYAPTVKDRFGYVVGGGVEYAIQDHLTAGIEYAYQDFGDTAVDFTPAGAENDYNPPFSIRANSHYSTLLFRVNYKY